MSSGNKINIYNYILKIMMPHNLYTCVNCTAVFDSSANPELSKQFRVKLLEQLYNVSIHLSAHLSDFDIALSIDMKLVLTTYTLVPSAYPSISNEMK